MASFVDPHPESSPALVHQGYHWCLKKGTMVPMRRKTKSGSSSVSRHYSKHLGQDPIVLCRIADDGQREIAA
jgi:hypothetical protein